MANRSRNSNSRKNLKQGNPKTQFKKNDPKTKEAANKGNEVKKNYRQFRNLYKEKVESGECNQDEIINTLQKMSVEGDIQAMRLLFDMLGETRLAVDIAADKEFRFIIEEPDR